VSNVLGVVTGVILIILGLILLVAWWSMFIKGLMAILPILLILFGAGALVYFISEIKSKLEIQKENTPSTEEKKGE
jgi:membrane-bound ClpP family serine protease